MTPQLRFSGAVSAGLHGVLLLALLLSLEPPHLPPLDSAAVTMEFALEPAQVQRAQTPAPTPAAAPAEVPTPDQPSPVKPRPTPVEAPPPPPPPPPPPAPLAPPVPPPPVPPAPPAPAQAIQAPLVAAPAPPQAVSPPLPLPPTLTPPPPAPTPPAPRLTPQTAPPIPKPDPRLPTPRPAPERPNPGPRNASTSSQSNPTRNTADDSRTLEATLERYRSQQRQTQAPTHAYNPPAGGAVGGGSVAGIENAKLSAAQRGAVGDRIRECYTQDTGGKDYAQQWARIMVTTDASGVVRDTKVLATSGGALGHVFAERAARAAQDPQCAKLPLPGQMLGQNHTFEIMFRP